MMVKKKTLKQLIISVITVAMVFVMPFSSMTVNARGGDNILTEDVFAAAKADPGNPHDGVVYSPETASANEGFEILAHNSEPLYNANEDQIRKSMIDGKKVVESLGLVCHGWVTPSSSLPEIHQHIVKDYFEYGYTGYKGNQATGQTETNDLQSYQLWRVHMNVLKDNYKRIFADMIQEKGMVSVYAHGVELNNPDNWTLNDLRTILQYCKSNDIDVLTPYDSCRRLFSE